jgi:hypothetical protein
MAYGQKHALHQHPVFKKFYFSFIFLFIYFSPSVYAWNSMGHRIIGEIAYEHLAPKTKEHVDELINYLADAYPYESNFQTANAWADYLRQDDIHTYDAWHFYNQPFSGDNTPLKSPASQNLLWALNQSISILKSPKSNQFEKAFFIRFLLHLTGDAHQPLHCSDRFSNDLPNGDAGGNLFRTQNSNYANLHAYWDDGLGLFEERCGFSPSKFQRAKCLSQKIQNDYPENSFGNKINNLNPEEWINESFVIAKNSVYLTDENKPLSANYISNNQQIVEQRAALAGYRLANVLNSIFN